MDDDIPHVPNQLMTPDEEVAMILGCSKKDGPTTSKRARLKSNSNVSSNSDDEPVYRPSQNRLIGHGRQIWDDSSDSDSASSVETKVFPNVEYLASIPKFDVKEHNRISYYMDILGENAKEIRTDLPKSDHYADEQMEVVKNNYILSQLDCLIRENLRRKSRDTPDETQLLSLIKPLATIAKEKGHKPE